MKEIADTGLLVALLFRNDPFHNWALEAFRGHAPFCTSFYTCEAMLAEAASFCPDPVALLKLVIRGDVLIDPDFSVAKEAVHLASLASKYADRPMDLADACLVRMSELRLNCRIWTVDRSDFVAYRRMGRKAILGEFPPNC
ncbi:MAG: type II toxin-antitoxin system VapC family toxin [Verrucomicrobiales bacterium]